MRDIRETAMRPAQPGAMRLETGCDQCGARASNVCSTLAFKDLDRLARIAEPMIFAPGQSFIRESSPAEHFFNITSGTARLFKMLADGRQQITGFAGEGHFLGLAVPTAYAYGAEAVDTVRLCRYPRQRLMRLLAEFPAMERRMLEEVSNELVAAQEQMLLLGRKNARERIASFLVRRMAITPLRHGVALPRIAMVRLPMARRDIGDYLGMTIETVSRTLGTMKREGMIAIPDPARIVIQRPAALLALANGLA